MRFWCLDALGLLVFWRLFAGFASGFLLVVWVLGFVLLFGSAVWLVWNLLFYVSCRVGIVLEVVVL